MGFISLSIGLMFQGSLESECTLMFQGSLESECTLEILLF